MKNKLKITLKKWRRNIIEYIATNRLFISYIILSLIGLVFIRSTTVNNATSIAPFIVDLAVVLIVGSFGYLVKPKNRFRYFFIILIIFTLMEVINSIYYRFYYDFASFGALSAVGQTEAVTEAILERLNVIRDLGYLLIPIIFYIIHKTLNNTSYYNYVSVVEKSKKMAKTTLLVGSLFLLYSCLTATSYDFSKLAKPWNRTATVKRFGIVLYQLDDLVQTLTPRINELFGYEEASQNFLSYYTDEKRNEYKGDNAYTNILEGKNIIFVHMEGMETFLTTLEFNGQEVTPNLNKLIQEGMFFTNFYPQVNSGTSSDTEFTLLTSLMPAFSGPVFTGYADREYVTIPKLLKEKGYYTFSMHGNHASMWNRYNVHPLLGYDDMYFKEAFTFNDDCEDENNMECINLGISDKLFFKQAIPILEKIEAEHTNYMGTIITLSNHSPFKYLDKYGPFDLTTTYEECNEIGICDEVVSDYLENTAVGNYIKSAHYADEALGEFIEYINESEYFNNTVFVFYGDHDVKLSQKQKNYLYNYDYKTNKLKSEDDPTYQEYDYYDHELNKKTPLIIWTKDESLRSILNGKVDYIMGMYDVMPTLGNMLNIHNDYALGHDIFNIKDNNFVVFPTGNFLTNLIYYNNSSGQYKILKDKAVLTNDYISNLINQSEELLEVSNSIIVHDLIREDGEKLKNIRMNGDSE